MPIIDALKFIHEFRLSQSFRDTLNSNNAMDLPAYLLSKGYSFSTHEFEDAIRSLRLKCRDEDAAEEIQQIGLWYKLQAGEQ